VGIGEGLDQSQFLVAQRLVELAELGQMGLIERGIFGGQQDGAPVSPVLRALREDVPLPSSNVGP
jgi:hypothetical protein